MVYARSQCCPSAGGSAIGPSSNTLSRRGSCSSFQISRKTRSCRLRAWPPAPHLSSASVDRGRSRRRVALFDVDRFKRINDERGHAVGDQVLAGVGRVIDGLGRASGIAVRWGGGELLVLLANIDEEGGRAFAGRVRW